MARFWTREVAGWLLVLLGLFGFYIAFVMMTERQIVQSSFVTFISVMIFRGGIHLVKVAVAARICMRAHERLAQEPEARGKRTEVRGQRTEVRSHPFGRKTSVE